MSMELVVNKVGELILAHSQLSGGVYKTLRDFQKWELEYFPLKYLLHCASASELNDVWWSLPQYYRENKELQLCLPCLEHYNKGIIHFDGPPLRKKTCPECTL